MTEKKQIKSKKRVADLGEVFTNEREVNAMLDFVKDESFNIESTFLEPACGDGNFLAPILERKLLKVKEMYGKSKSDYEKYSLIALSSLYGVELMIDNVEACTKRLFDIYDKEYIKQMKKDASSRVRDVAYYIIRKNILCGDALTLLRADKTPITFCEWKWVKGSMVKRRDYQLSKMLKAETYTNEMADVGNENQLSLFFASGEDKMKEIYDSVNKPINDYPLVDYKELDKYA